LSSDDDDITRIEDIPDFNPEDLDDDFLSLDDLATDMGLSSDEKESVNEKNEDELELSNLTNNELNIPTLPDSEEEEDFSSDFDSPPNFDVNELQDNSKVFEPRDESFDSEDSTSFFDDKENNTGNEDFSSFDEQNDESLSLLSTEDGDENDFSTPDSDDEFSSFDSFIDEAISEDTNDQPSDKFENFTNDVDEQTDTDVKEDDTPQPTQNFASFSNLDGESEESTFDTFSESRPDIIKENISEDLSLEEDCEELLTASTQELASSPAIEQEQDPVDDTELNSGDTDTFTPTSELTPAQDLNEITEKEVSTTKTPILKAEPEKPITAPERFEDIKAFSEKITYGNFSAEGNPPFSVIIKDVKFHEDVDSICESLMDLKIIDSDRQEHCKESLTRGQMLIPRLSEYAAIILCHKLRHFDIEILMGLTEELHPPKSYESNDRGLSSKYTVYNNRKNHFNFKNNSSTDEILTSTLPNIQDHQIIKYIGIITETKQITTQELTQSTTIEDEIVNQFSDNERSTINELRVTKENINASTSKVVESIFGHESGKSDNKLKLDTIYSELLEKLKLKALKKEANGIVGINFSITPITIENYLSNGPKYQILCTGNMVWIEKK
jgi:uncharacterized protein YbjQ (UPF0145 family)